MHSGDLHADAGPAPARDRLAISRADHLLLLPVLLLALALFVAGISWGVFPGSDVTWAPDEITPSLVINGLQRRFSDGWYSRYPPFHFYVLSVAFAPIVAAHFLDLLNAYADWHYFVYAARVTSLVMALGILCILYACAVTLFHSRRAGALAALVLVVTLPFAYYAKLANVDVPYLFWYSLSLLALLRLLHTRALRHALGFVVSAVLAVATKDQAYGLYLLLLPILAAVLVRPALRRGEPLGRILLHGLRDRRVVLGTTVAVLLTVVVFNIPFNRGGVIRHLQLITGDASQPFRLYDRSPAGQASLLVLAGRHLFFMLGPPLVLICTLGLLRQLTTWRKTGIWLMLVSLASYYVTFIAVIGYHYDRFFLPFAFVLALLAGAWLAEFTAPGVTARPFRIAVLVGVFAFSVLRVAAVDGTMPQDSRLGADRWLAAHLDSTAHVLAIGRPHHLPHLEHFQSTTTERIPPDWFRAAPDIIITTTNVWPENDSTTRLLADLASGSTEYACIWQSTPAPTPNLLLDFTGIFSNLDLIDPVIRIYQRNGPPGSARC